MSEEEFSRLQDVADAHAGISGLACLFIVIPLAIVVGAIACLAGAQS